MLMQKVRWYWPRLWMRLSGIPYVGRIATRLALLGVPPFLKRCFLARITSKGFISPSSALYGHTIKFGSNVFIDDHVLIYQEEPHCGPVEIGDRVKVFEGTHIIVGPEGGVHIGSGTSIHRGCQIDSYKAPIRIGRGVEIAARCDFQSFDHGIAPDRPIANQPLTTKGPIIIEDEAWLGYGVIVLSGVRIGKGAVIGAGALVNKDVPPGAVAVGVPARVVRLRSDLKLQDLSVVVADAQISLQQASVWTSLHHDDPTPHQ
jgi:acetyltransferase-like isoleucine patch superfamily enzyme